MIDFANAKYLKLREVDEKEGQKLVGDLLIDDEDLIGSFKTVRDMVIFTNKRIIAVNLQGWSGKKKRISPLFPIARFRLSVLKVLEPLTSMLN